MIIIMVRELAFDGKGDLPIRAVEVCHERGNVLGNCEIPVQIRVHVEETCNEMP